MKRAHAFFLSFALVGAMWFSSVMSTATCGAAPKGDDTEEIAQRYRDEIVSKYGGNIEWLTFSATEFAEERRLIREHYAEFFDNDEALTKVRIIILVAKADLNGDGRPDMIWKILHPYYHSHNTSATWGISYYDGDELKHAMFWRVTWVPIGLRASEDSHWKEVIADHRLYRWDGKGYFFVEKR